MYKLFFRIDKTFLFGYNICESRDVILKTRLQNMNVKNKRVILRVDYNVPMQSGQILDDSKITETLPTIRYLLDQNCSI